MTGLIDGMDSSSHLGYLCRHVCRIEVRNLGYNISLQVS
jgi:hypothetical protein